MKIANKPDKSIFILLLIIATFSALILRLINIDYPTGLWFDEMLSLTAAKQSFPFGITHWLCVNDVHLPFYFYILHFWMNLFGDGDITLRFLSVLFGVLNVLVIYMLGKEMESEKTGIVAAFFVAINSFLIYYSQEVRFYSLIPLLASLSILFATKTFKKPDTKHLTGLVIINIFLIFTYPLAIIFAAFEVVIFGLYIFKNNKSVLNKFLITQMIPFLIFMTYLPGFLVQVQSKQWLHSFTEAYPPTIFLYFANWFSPILSGLYSNDFSYPYYNSPDFLFFIVLPVIIVFIGIFISIFNQNFSKNELSRIIFIICLLNILTDFILVLTGNLHWLICRYTIFVVPLLLLVSVNGLLSIPNKILSLGFIIIFILLNVSYINFGTFSIINEHRNGGYKIPVEILKSYKRLNPKDIILCDSGGAFLKRYAQNKYGNILPPFLFTMELKDIKQLTDKKIIPDVQQYVNENIINKLEKNRYVVLILGKNYSSQKSDDDITQNVYNYLESKIINDLVRIISQKYKLIYGHYSYNWHVLIYQNT